MNVEVSKHNAEQILNITKDLADNLITLYNNLTEAKKLVSLEDVDDFAL